MATFPASSRSPAAPRGRWFRFLFLVFTLPFALRAADPAADKTLSPYFWIKSAPSAGSDFAAADPLPLKSTAVETTIAGVIADVHVTQVYTNTGTAPLEAIYVFPGSTRAAVHGLTLSIGDRRLEAKIKKRDEARQTYEVAKTAGKTASLLEQQRPNVFQMNVANILPGDEIHVDLRYTELLVPTDGVYEFVYPGVVGPRYSHASAAESSDSWVANPYLKKGYADSAGYRIGVTLSAGLPIEQAECRTHPTQIRYTDATQARIELDPSAPSPSNRDFILRYRLAGGAIHSGAILAQGKDENFFLLMLQPPERPLPSQVPPRDFIFIVDVSGSMNGFPLTTAKKLMHDLLGSLRPIDTFDLLLFSGGSEMLAPASVPATPENIAAATRLLDQQNGAGATELVPALRRALALPQPENVSRTVAVITDGYVDVEHDAFSLVRANLGRANLFAFGIGSSVNRHLIEGLARAGEGEPFIVTDGEAAGATAAHFRDYISSPVLTHVQVDYRGFDTYEVEPSAVPDVFAQRPVVVFGKWRGAKTGRIHVRGMSGDRPYETEIDLAQATTLADVDGLAHLWARNRVAELSDLVELDRNPDLETAITNLGLTYNLLTRYTSFIAVDDVVRRTTPTLQTIKQPLPLPQGVENSAVGQSLPTSPEPGTVGLVLVAAFVLAVLGLWPMRRNRSS